MRCCGSVISLCIAASSRSIELTRIVEPALDPVEAFVEASETGRAGNR
jgi:hypothetical protein